MKILVPMDFTEVSLNAFDYATQRFPAASITVLHVVSGLTNVKFPYHVQSGVTYDLALTQELEEILVEHLGTSELPDQVKIEVYYGEPVNVIRKYLKDHSYDAVFLGSRDKYDVLDKIFGTTSLGVIKSVKDPVFVIPKYAKYKGYKKILVAAGETIADPDTIMAINYWNSSNAHVNFLHVKEGSKDASFAKAKEGLLVGLYEDYQPPFSYDIEEVKSEQKAESLLARAYADQADLLISVARNASFLQSLIFKNLSKELIMKSAIPVLFLHSS